MTAAPRPLKIVEAIDAYWRERSFAPSVRDLCDGAGIPATVSVAYHLRRLRAAGLVAYEDRIARSVRLTPAGEALLTGEEVPLAL